MSAEVLLMILEKLELYDLLQVVQTSKYFSNLAEDVFRRRYSSKIFDITSLDRFHGDSRDLVSVTHTHIYIENVQLSALILRVFGHLIHQISINFFYITSVERNHIERVIENFCSESLNRIDFLGFDIDVLSTFTKPLRGVERVTIQGKFISSDVNVLGLNELFPNLRQLSLSYIDVFHPNMFDVQFLQLEHFDINLQRISVQQSPEDFIRNMKMAVENLLRKNPTIKSLILSDCDSLDVLKIVSEYSLNLEEITVNFIALDQYKGKQMDFFNVKKVDFAWTNYNMSGVMLFDKLEDMKLSCIARECIEFVKQNRNVKKLNMFGSSLSAQDILTIADTLPNLVELTLVSDVKIQADPIIQLIQKSKNLEKVILDVFGTELFNVLSHQVTGDWTIKETTYKIILEKVSNV